MPLIFLILLFLSFYRLYGLTVGIIVQQKKILMNLWHSLSYTILVLALSRLESSSTPFCIIKCEKRKEKEETPPAGGIKLAFPIVSLFVFPNYVQMRQAAEGEDSGVERGKSGSDKNGEVGQEKGSDTAEKQSKDRGRSKSRRMRELQSKMGTIEIPRREDTLELFKREQEQEQEEQAGRKEQNGSTVKSPLHESETTAAEENSSDSDEFTASFEKLFLKIKGEGKESWKENMKKKMNSCRGYVSYGLAEQLTSRWSTGAGARIGFMKSCPPKELRFRILEEANLSPRTEAKNSVPRNPSLLSNLNHLKRGNPYRSPLDL